MEKIFITPNEFYEDSFRLAKKVYDSGFRPSFLIGVWRGGTPPGVVIHEFLKFKGCKVDHIAIRTSRYDGIDKKSDNVGIHGLGYIIERLVPGEKILIVDDVVDEGVTMKKIVEEITQRSGKNIPEIKVASVYYKPERNKANFKPDFHIHETDEWIIFPHELEGLNSEELKKKNGDIWKIVTE